MTDEDKKAIEFMIQSYLKKLQEHIDSKIEKAVEEILSHSAYRRKE